MHNYFLISLLAAILSVAGALHDSASIDTPSIDDLQTKKLELELIKLEAELTHQRIVFWTSLIGSAVGVGALFWTIMYGLRTIRGQTLERHHSRVSALLEGLSSSSEAARVGAARGLSQYADDTVQELLAAASIEESGAVRPNLENALTYATGQAKTEVVRANSQTLLQRMHLAGRMRMRKFPSETVCSLLRLNESTLKRIRRHYRVEYEHGRRLEQLHAARTVGEAVADFKGLDLQELARHLAQLHELTRNVIARWLRNSDTVLPIERPLDLSEANLYRSNLSQITGAGFVFDNALMRHVDLRLADVDYSSMVSANLYDCKIDRARFQRTTFAMSQLRKCQGNKVHLIDCDLSWVKASEADFTEATFQSTKCTKGMFRTASFSRGLLTDCLFDKVEMQQAVLDGAQLSEVMFFGAKLQEADFGQTILSQCKFNGADLRGANFAGANLSHVDFAGARVDNADFQGAEFAEVQWKHCKGVESARFDSNPQSEIATD